MGWGLGLGGGFCFSVTFDPQLCLPVCRSPAAAAAAAAETSGQMIPLTTDGHSCKPTIKYGFQKSRCDKHMCRQRRQIMQTQTCGWMCGCKQTIGPPGPVYKVVDGREVRSKECVCVCVCVCVCLCMHWRISSHRQTACP